MSSIVEWSVNPNSGVASCFPSSPLPAFGLHCLGLRAFLGTSAVPLVAQGSAAAWPSGTPAESAHGAARPSSDRFTSQTPKQAAAPASEEVPSGHLAHLAPQTQMNQKPKESYALAFT